MHLVRAITSPLFGALACILAANPALARPEMCPPVRPPPVVGCNLAAVEEENEVPHRDVVTQEDRKLARPAGRNLRRPAAVR